MATVLGFTVEPWGSAAIGTYLIPGTTVKLSMRKEVAPLLVAFCRDFDREVEPLHPGWCWGFNPKKIEGSTAWSNHAWGGAVDLNAPAHPMGKRGTFSASKQKALRKILDRYTFQGHRLIRSGMEYAGRPDDMHAEVIVPRAVALAAVKALQTPKPSTKPKPSGNTPGSRVVRQGSVGADVGLVQRWTGTDDDNKFGPATKARVIRWQGIVGLPKTGVVDADDWSKILGRTIKL